MDNSEEALRIAIQFDSYCKKVLKNEKITISRERRSYENHYVSFSSLSFLPWQKVAVYDEYPMDVTEVYIDGESMAISDDVLLEAIENLPTPSKEIIVMNYFEELSIAEIAKELNISEGKTYYQRKRGIKKIKEQLGGR
jgi:RNA polymerase sigma factor (sigma-70 family)